MAFALLLECSLGPHAASTTGESIDVGLFLILDSGQDFLLRCHYDILFRLSEVSIFSA